MINFVDNDYNFVLYQMYIDNKPLNIKIKLAMPAFSEKIIEYIKISK